MPKVKLAPENEWTKDGRKYYFNSYDKKANGKAVRYTSKKFLTREEAEKEMALHILKNKQNKSNNMNMLFSELYTLFYEYQKDKVKPTTLTGYRNVTPHLKYFYDVKMCDLNIEMINEWKNEINKKKLALRTKNGFLKLLKAILNFGTTWYNMDFRTLYPRIKRFTDPYNIPKEMEYYTFDEFTQYISVEDDLKYICLFKTLYYCGLRIGELKGLKWSDIDFHNRLLKVIRNVVDVPNEGKSYTITSPKTRPSIRTIPVAKHLINNLLIYKKDCSSYYGFNNNWFVFGDVDPIASSTIRDRNNKNSEKAGIKRIRIHDFRHSCVSLLIDKGANITLVAKYMGHSKIDETLNTYAHFYRNTLNGIVKLLDDIEDDFI